jgi:putative hydroxymethylpyrimidine transport system permease protein
MKIRKRVFFFLYLFCLVCILQVILVIFKVPSYIFPTPLSIMKTLITEFNVLSHHAFYTFIEALGGVFIAFVCTLLLGGIFLYYRIIKYGVYPLIFLFQMVPLVGLGPLFILWFGFGIFPKVLIVALFAIYPILVSFLGGYKDIPSEMFQWLFLIKATRFQSFRYLIYPYCFRSLFRGTRIATTYSVTSAMVAELLGAEKGLGIFLSRALSSYNMQTLFAGIVFVFMVTCFLYFLSHLLEKRLNQFTWSKK